MSKINKELQAYRTENAEIREKLFSQASFTNVASRASELGFAKARSQFVLTVSDAILTTSSLAIRQ